jgi:uncharacterized membrane protein
MTVVTISMLVVLAFIGAVLLLLPHISPRRFLFAITVPPGFHSTPGARRALRRYHWLTAASIVLGAILTLVIPLEWAPAAIAVPFLGAMAGFLRERSYVRRIAGPISDERQAELSVEPNRLPGWFWLVLPPFVLPAAVMLYLRAHWNEIPERFPIHWSFQGPNRWTGKSISGVYGSLLYGEALMFMFLLLALAIFYGARRSPQRDMIMKLMVVGTYVFGCLFGAIALQPLLNFPPVWFLAAPAVFVIVALVFGYRIVRDSERTSEATPDECWYLGTIYFDSQDPAVFVQKRFGFGYTFNFGSRWSWVLLAAILSVPLAMTVVLPH